MVKVRKKMVLFCAFFLVASHMLVFALDQGKHWHNSWPILYYSMYSKIYDMEVSKRIQIVGKFETQEGGVLESFPIEDSKYIQPFTGRHLERALKSYPKDLFKVLASDILNKYQSRKQRGFHTGPDLKKIELYWVSWDLKSVLNREPIVLSKELIVESDSYE